MQNLNNPDLEYRGKQKVKGFSTNITETLPDKATGEIKTAIPVKPDKWKINLVDTNGKKTYWYFSKEQVDRVEVRRKIDAIPFDEHNNVEAAMFQYSFHTRNNKTRYRTLIKHSLQAIARYARINMRRIFCLITNKVSK